MKTMFCLVSRQSMANVLPVLMFKPEKVVLFSTPEENKSANNLKKLFEKKKIKVIQKEGLNAYDFVSFKNVVNNALKITDEIVWLNITGGTKLMALAAYEAFSENNKTIIYCDTEHQNIIFLNNDKRIEKLNADLSIEDYLISYGFNIKETKDITQVEKYFPLFEFIIENNLMNEFINLFRRIRKKLSDDMPKITLLSINKNFIFRKNYDVYSIQYNTNDKKNISIHSSEFKYGDWLEYYTFYNLKKKYNLSPLTGVKIISQDNVENEIDVLVMKDFVLHNYSCKSGRSDNQFDLFQLETLRNIASGTFGKGYFVISKKSTPRFADRAKELNIKVINVLYNVEKFI